jgi:hypothetical protein
MFWLTLSLILVGIHWSSANPSVAFPANVDIYSVLPVANHTYAPTAAFPISIVVENTYAAFAFNFIFEYDLIKYENYSGILNYTLYSGFLEPHNVTTVDTYDYTWNSSISNISIGNWALAYTFTMTTCSGGTSSENIINTGSVASGSFNFTIANGGMPADSDPGSRSAESSFSITANSSGCPYVSPSNGSTSTSSGSTSPSKSIANQNAVTCGVWVLLAIALWVAR